MADSKRLQILKALTGHLEGVTGYNLQGKVWRGRSRPSDESNPPFILIFEMPPEYQDQADTRTASMPWYVGLQGYIRPDTNHPTDPAHNFMAAVKQRLAKVMDDGGPDTPPPEFLLNGLIEGMEVDGGMCFDADDTTNCCFFAMKLTLTVVENLENPYE